MHIFTHQRPLISQGAAQITFRILLSWYYLFPSEQFSNFVFKYFSSDYLISVSLSLLDDELHQDTDHVWFGLPFVSTVPAHVKITEVLNV